MGYHYCLNLEHATRRLSFPLLPPEGAPAKLKAPTLVSSRWVSSDVISNNTTWNGKHSDAWYVLLKAQTLCEKTVNIHGFLKRVMSFRSTLLSGFSWAATEAHVQTTNTTRMFSLQKKQKSSRKGFDLRKCHYCVVLWLFRKILWIICSCVHVLEVDGAGVKENWKM